MVRFTLSTALAASLLAFTSSVSAAHTVTCNVDVGVNANPVPVSVIKDFGTPGAEAFEFSCEGTTLRSLQRFRPAPMWVINVGSDAFEIDVSENAVFDFLPGSDATGKALIDGSAGTVQKVVVVGDTGATTITANAGGGHTVYVDCSLFGGSVDINVGADPSVVDCSTCALGTPTSPATNDVSAVFLAGDHGTCSFHFDVPSGTSWAVAPSAGGVAGGDAIGDAALVCLGTCQDAGTTSAMVVVSSTMVPRAVRCGGVGAVAYAAGVPLGGFVVRAVGVVGQVACTAKAHSTGIADPVTVAEFRNVADLSMPLDTLVDPNDPNILIAKRVLGWVVFMQDDAQQYGVFTLGLDGVNHELREMMVPGAADTMCAGESACVIDAQASDFFMLTLEGALGAREYGYFDCGDVTADVEVTAVPLNVVGDATLTFGRWIQAGVCAATCGPTDLPSAADAAVEGGMRAVVGSSARCVLQYDAAAMEGVQVSACEGTITAPLAATTVAEETVLKACTGGLMGDSCMRAEYADNTVSSTGGAQFFTVATDANKCASAQIVRCSMFADIDFLVVKAVGTANAATANVNCAAGVATVTAVGDGADVSAWAMAEGSAVFLTVAAAERLFIGAVTVDLLGKVPVLRNVMFAGETLGNWGGATACDGVHACVVEVDVGAFVLQWSDFGVMRPLSYVDCTRAGAATFEVVLQAKEGDKIKTADVMFTCGAGCGAFVDAEGNDVVPLGAEVVAGSADDACVVGFSAIEGTIGGVFGCKAALVMDDAVTGAVTVEGDGCVADSGSCFGTATAKSSFLVFEADDAVCEIVGGSKSKSKSKSGSGSGSGSKEKEIVGTIAVDGEFFIPILELLIGGAGANVLITPDSEETVDVITGAVVPKKVLKSLMKALKKAQKRSLKTFNKVAKAMAKAGFGLFFAPVCVASCTAVEPSEGDVSGFEVVCFGCGVTTGADVDVSSTLTAEVAAGAGATVTPVAGGTADVEVVAARRQGGGGAKPVVICAATTAADQVRCFERAACAGLVTAGAAECSVSGVTRACPVCPEASSSSKKGLLGLLGLLALIPLCLLCVCLLVCCLVLKKRSGSPKAASMAAFSVTTCPMPSVYPSAGVVCGSPLMTTDHVLPTMPLPASQHMHSFSPHCAGTMNTHL